jgi:hypothetical protein
MMPLRFSTEKPPMDGYWTGAFIGIIMTFLSFAILSLLGVIRISFL